MSIAEKKTITFEEAWAYLQQAFENVTSMADDASSYTVTPDYYMSCYTTVYILCNANWGAAIQLYSAYKTNLEDYISSKILPSLKEAEKEDIVASFDKSWSKCKLITRWFSMFLRYLDRYASRKNLLPSIEQVSYLCFYDKVYGELNEQIKDAIVAMIRHEREGNQIDEKVLNSVMGIYKDMAKTNEYAKYTNELEEALFRDAVNFYSNKAFEWTNSISSNEDYMLKVNEWLEQERSRVSSYLREKTLDDLLDVIYGELLSKRATF